MLTDGRSTGSLAASTKAGEKEAHKMAAKRHGERYYVENNYARLRTTLEQEESVDGCRAAIDESNRQAEAKGYKPEKWMILHEVWDMCYYPNGVFKEANKKITFVEFYPAGLW